MMSRIHNKERMTVDSTSAVTVIATRWADAPFGGAVIADFGGSVQNVFKTQLNETRCAFYRGLGIESSHFR